MLNMVTRRLCITMWSANQFSSLSLALFVHLTGLSRMWSLSWKIRISPSEVRDGFPPVTGGSSTAPVQKSHQWWWWWCQVRKCREGIYLTLPAGPHSTFNKEAKREPLNNIGCQCPQPRNRKCHLVTAAQPHPYWAGKSYKPAKVPLSPSCRYNQFKVSI